MVNWCLLQILPQTLVVNPPPAFSLAKLGNLEASVETHDWPGRGAMGPDWQCDFHQFEPRDKPLRTVLDSSLPVPARRRPGAKPSTAKQTSLRVKKSRWARASKVKTQLAFYADPTQTRVSSNSSRGIDLIFIHHLHRRMNQLVNQSVALCDTAANTWNWFALPVRSTRPREV